MKRTERGFAIYTEFVDEGGVRIEVQESSLATADRVWVRLRTDTMTVAMPRQTVVVSAHLDRRRARRLIKALECWLKGDR